MTALARAGWRTLSLSEFGIRRTAHSAPRTFLLTFDDGYASLAEHAYPVLADLGFTATTFLITDYVGKTNTWDVRYTWNRLQHLSWTAIEQWRARGLEFASHGATHRRLTWLDDASLEAELRGSRETLTARLGPDAGRAVAYPFGAVNPRVLGIAQTAGYELGFGGRARLFLGCRRCAVRLAGRWDRSAGKDCRARGESLCRRHNYHADVYTKKRAATGISCGFLMSAWAKTLPIVRLSGAILFTVRAKLLKDSSSTFSRA